MIYGNTFLKEEYGYKSNESYISEGSFKIIKDTLGSKIRGLAEKFKKPPKAKTDTSTKSMSIEEYINSTEVIIKKGTSADMDRIYNTDGIAIEGIDFFDFKEKRELQIAMLKKLIDAGIHPFSPFTVYVFSGKDVNKHYDLEGNNAYKDSYHISVFSFTEFSFAKDINYARMKYLLEARYWCDVVDNNEYKEYMKGRHKYTKNIQWLIDASNRD